MGHIFVYRRVVQVLPPGVLGGLPGRAAWESYYCTQVLIENAHLMQGSLYGSSMDIVKFFKCLPRAFVRQILTAVKVPLAVVNVWVGLLDSVHRRLRVQGSLSVHLERVSRKVTR